MRLSSLFIITSLPTVLSFMPPALRGKTSLRENTLEPRLANTEVVEASYTLAQGFIAFSTAFIPGEAGSLALGENPKLAKIGATVGGLPLFLVGLAMAYQASNVRFTFDETNFALVKTDASAQSADVSENRWSYDSFVNYDFFPSEQVPILIYFKETQTPQEKWGVGPGALANAPEALSRGAVPGQVHFFPAVGNVKQLKAGFESHNCAAIRAPEVKHVKKVTGSGGSGGFLGPGGFMNTKRD